MRKVDPKRAARLAAMQGRMRDAAEIARIALEHRAEAVCGERADLLAAMGGPAGARLPLDAAARRLASLAAEADKLAAAAARQAEAVREAGLTQKRTEAWAERLAVEARRAAERRAGLDRLDDLAGRTAGSDDASLP